MLRPLACALFALGLGVTACASETSSSSSSADVEASNLSAKTFLKGSIAVGQTVSLAYEPGEYAANGLPYLGVTLEATDASEAPTTGDAGAGMRRITVGGGFPGTPHLLLVDPAFKVIAEADGVRTANGAQATVAFPASAFRGRNTLLVQDPRWNAPMEFDVTAE